MSQSQSKRWCFTLNNYTEEDCVNIALWDVKYMLVGKEQGHTTNTPHLQAYVIFKKNQRLSAVKKLQSSAHWEIAKGTTEQNITYCTKENDYQEYGTKPTTPKEKGLMEKERWTEIIKSIEDGTVKEQHPEIYIKYNGTCNRLLKRKVEDNEELCGEWYYGESGTGKSRSARTTYPDLYDKLLNKWWDGYQEEETVLLDDLDHTHASHMGQALKRYADHYPFRAEVKGSSMVIRPKKIIVTSQYTIEQLWPDDTELQQALKRRFKMTHFKKIKNT